MSVRIGIIKVDHSGVITFRLLTLGVIKSEMGGINEDGMYDR